VSWSAKVAVAILLSTGSPVRADKIVIEESCSGSYVVSEGSSLRGTTCKCQEGAQKRFVSERKAKPSLTTDAGWVTWVWRNYNCAMPAREEATVQLYSGAEPQGSRDESPRAPRFEAAANHQAVGLGFMTAGLASVVLGGFVFTGTVLGVALGAAALPVALGLAVVGVGATFLGAKIALHSLDPATSFIKRATDNVLGP
jgi:hypothetical protein